MPNKENLKPFKKGIDARRNTKGAPRKYISLLKEKGYKQSEANDCIQVLLSMTIEELGKVWADPKATALEKLIISAMRKDMQRGSLYCLETLLSRVYGKPRETVDVQSEEKITITLGK
jgi:hypothetical protein